MRPYIGSIARRLVEDRDNTMYVIRHDDEGIEKQFGPQ